MEKLELAKTIHSSEVKNSMCLICEVEAESEEEIVLSGCKHTFCKDCLTSFFENEIKENKLPLKCPGDRNKCKYLITPDIILSNINERHRNKFLDFSLKKYFDDFGEELSWCPTPSCQYGFEISKVCNKFSCPICLKHYCLKCRTECHDGKSCDENKSKTDLDKQFLELARSTKMKQCPKCKHWIEKNEGCNHMTCICKYEFCYVCGEPSTVSHTNCKFKFTAPEVREAGDREIQRNANENNRELNNMTRIIDNMYTEIERRNRQNVVYQPLNFNSERRYVNSNATIGLNSNYTSGRNYNNIGSNYINTINDTMPRKKDGTLDMRYSINKNAISTSTTYSSISNSVNKSIGFGPTKKDGTLDMRYSVNKHSNYSQSNFLNSTSSYHSGPRPTKKDGTLDMRYSVNKSSYSNSSSFNLKSNYSSYSGGGPRKKDGTLDMRFAVNKRK